MKHLLYLLKNKRKAFIALLFLCLTYHFGFTQAVQNDIYVDYDEMVNQVPVNLKAAQLKIAFPGSAFLKQQTLSLPSTAKADLHAMPRPGKKELTNTQIINARKDGVLMIYKYMSATSREPQKCQLYATATALTADGICVSNWHVFMGIIQPEEQLAANDSLTFVVTLQGDVYPIERILAYSKDADAAIFKVNTGNKSLQPVPLGNALEVGETVHSLTHPDEYPYYYSKGVVARNTANHAIGPMANRMEITADYAKGSSGGPILDNRGNMAGMVSTTFSIYARDLPQANLQMVIKKTVPVMSIRQLIKEN
jgi:serine protease Do